MTTNVRSLERPIVVGVDGSPESLRALRWGAAEAVRRHKPLALVHAKNWPTYGAPLTPMWGAATLQAIDEASQAVIEQAIALAKNLMPGLPVGAEVVEGTTERALLDHARGAELVAVGRRGRGGFTNLLLGSSALAVARHASCPVVVVPDTDNAESGTGVLAGVDTSDYSQEVLGFAFAEASLRAEKLTVVRTWFHTVDDAPALTFPAPALPEEYLAEQERLLSELMAGWREKFPEVTVEHRILRARPSSALVKLSSEAGLLVVGSRGEGGGLFNVLLGSVSDSLIRHAHCPVTIVHKGDSRIS